MRRPLLTAAATLLATVLTPVPPAVAHPSYHWTGGCRWRTTNDGTDAPTTRWAGRIEVSVTATTASGLPSTEWIDVYCVLVFSGAHPGTVKFIAGGYGHAAGSGDFGFQADPDEVVTTCEQVEIAGETHQACRDWMQVYDPVSGDSRGATSEGI